MAIKERIEIRSLQIIKEVFTSFFDVLIGLALGRFCLYFFYKNWPLG